MKTAVFIGLGSNLGDKRSNLEKARQEVSAIPGVIIKRASAIYWSKPWGYKEQDDFLNQVVELETELSPLDLLHHLQSIEIKMGRQHEIKWGPRIIDLDILLYGDLVYADEELQIPHTHMRERLFVLVPLQEINANLVFPDDGAYLREVLIRVPVRERNSIKKI
ncbi:MAG TPA: 2-amino-4-hydroxy-6-hydroxymethyldihydropteridine diphosphokinase [Syntrophomonadaceae bacterium]|nr:2-amino-4-hydroxy-6-hydroxymethyldihydropteridine diphosphokinase [Syntrophomonadaceae bacterium]